MSVGPPEILVIMIVALLVFGPQRLPEVGRQVGAAVRELRRMQDAVRGELDMVLHPEHGTSSSNAPAADEPGDHTAIGTGDVTSVEVTPEENTAGDVTSVEVPPEVAKSEEAKSEEDRRFLGPPDSFI